MRLLIIFMVSALLPCFLAAQNYVDNRPVVQAEGLTTQNAQFNFVSNNLNTTSSPSSFQNTGLSNAVFIEQVGFGNVVNAQVVSDNSQIFINQDGAYNVTGLRLNAQNITQNINQIGNSNLFLDYSVHGAVNRQVGINQIGNYNTTISTGRNGLSERLQVNQQGSGSTVYVIHY